MLVIALALVAVAAYGVQQRTERQASMAPTPQTPGALLAERQARGTSLPGVGRVRGLAAPCTAWLLAPAADGSATAGGAPPGEAAAHAVTAGRCTGIEDGATVLSRLPVDDVAIDLRTFAPDGDGDGVEPVTVPVVAVAWAAVRGTDLAILRLGATYAELATRGVPSITTAPAPVEGDQILVAGVPVAGVPADGVHLRGSRCAAGATTDVADGPWVLRGTTATGCRGILEGSAGSPALDPDGRAVGMAVTSTIGVTPSPDCALGRPCEIGPDGVSFQADTSYLVPVGGLGACLAGGGLRLGGDCPLEPPGGVVEASIGTSSVPAGSLLEVRIDPGSPAPGTTLVGMLAGTDCWSERGRRPARVDADGVLRVNAPTTQGLALLCVGSAAQPTPLRFTVAGTAPDAGAIELRETPVAGGILVEPVPSPPEYSTFAWVSGPAGTTDCATAEGYVPFTGEPAFIEAADLPSTVCVIASDAAGTPSTPQAFEVG
jgi:hypothetical protein